MLFILGVSLTLNAIFIAVSVLIFKFKKNDLNVLKNENNTVEKVAGINKDAVVDHNVARSFLK